MSNALASPGAAAGNAAPQNLDIPRVASIVNLVAMPVAIVLVGLVLADSHNPLRTGLAAVLFTIGAGSGLVQFLRIPDAALQAGLVIALSVALDLLVGQALLGFGNIDPVIGVVVLSGLTFVRPWLQRPLFPKRHHAPAIDGAGSPLPDSERRSEADAQETP